MSCGNAMIFTNKTSSNPPSGDHWSPITIDPFKGAMGHSTRMKFQDFQGFLNFPPLALSIDDCCVSHSFGRMIECHTIGSFLTEWNLMFFEKTPGVQLSVFQTSQLAPTECTSPSPADNEVNGRGTTASTG